MKKIVLISAAVAASLSFSASALAAGETQVLQASLTTTKANKSVPTPTGVTFNTFTSSSDPTGAKQTLTEAKITLPKGIALNYKNFKSCATATTCESAPQTGTAGPKIGSGSASADVQGVGDNYPGTLTPYIGPNSQLVIQTVFTAPAQIDEALVGTVSTSGGQYTFDFKVQEKLQQPLAGGFVQIRKFQVNFNKLTVKVGKKVVPLVGLVSCPAGGYVFTGQFTFLDGTQVNASAPAIKCTTVKAKKKK